MTETIKAYAYRGRHRLRGPSLMEEVWSVIDAKAGKASRAAWEWLRRFWAQAGLGVSLLALVLMLMQSSNSMIHQPTIQVSTDPVVVTLPTPFPMETTAVNT